MKVKAAAIIILGLLVSLIVLSNEVSLTLQGENLSIRDLKIVLNNGVEIPVKPNVFCGMYDFQRELLAWSQGGEQTITRQVSSGYDDAYEDLASNDFELDRTYIRVRAQDGGGIYHAGVRFTNITIPRGAEITSARLKLYLIDEFYDSMYAYIYGNDVDDAEDFSSNPHVFDENYRPRTDANVLWKYWAEGILGWHESPDISSVIQEIIDRPGWQSGNSIALLLIGGDPPGTGGVRMFEAASYEKDPAKAAILEVSYIVPLSQFKVTCDFNINGKYVRACEQAPWNTCNYTVNIYHNIDDDSTFIQAYSNPFFNASLPVNVENWSSSWINMLNASTTGSHSYYIKVEIESKAYDLNDTVTISKAYVILELDLTWTNTWTKPGYMLRIVETYNLYPSTNYPIESLNACIMIILISITLAGIISRQD